MIRLEDKKDCTGCGACAQACPAACIALTEDHEGFLYPQIDTDRCIDCSLCERVCPVINQGPEREPLKCFAARSCNDEIRRESSSGGLFTHLSQQTIQQGGVVFAAAFDAQWQVRHASAQSIEELAPFRGSKYVQSRVEQTFIEAREALRSGRKVLYSGTPCQIAGLKLFLGRDEENLLTVEVLCHGVPSPKVWGEYLRGVSGGDISAIGSVTFRDKSTSWRRFSLKICSTSGELLLREPLDVNTFLRGFNKGIFLRPSCYACPAKSLKSGSDITLGDYWGVERSHKKFNDNRGTSLVICNTVKGLDAMQGIDILAKECSYVEAIKSNPAATRSTTLPPSREKFFEAIDTDMQLALKEQLAQRLHTRIIRSLKIAFYTVLKR